MGIVRVQAEGLQALGLQCERHAGELTVSNAPALAGSPSQATVAAVRAATSGVTSASSALAARMISTGTKLSECAFVYRTQDEQSASNIEAASPGYQV
jgi:hypothetical protein